MRVCTKILQILFLLKVRTGIICKLSVSMNGGTWKPLLQALHKAPEDVLLYLSPGALGLTGSVKASNMADTCGMTGKAASN